MSLVGLSPSFPSAIAQTKFWWGRNSQKNRILLAGNSELWWCNVNGLVEIPIAWRNIKMLRLFWIFSILSLKDWSKSKLLRAIWLTFREKKITWTIIDKVTEIFIRICRSVILWQLQLLSIKCVVANDRHRPFKCITFRNTYLFETRKSLAMQ